MGVKTMSDLQKKKEETITGLIAIPLPLFNKEFPIIFFWNPKCGCTTLVKWFYFQIGILEQANQYSEWIHTFREKVYEQQPNLKLNLKNELLNLKKDTYKVIRNPYKRAVSSYIAALAMPEVMIQIAPDVKEGFSFRQFLYRLVEIGVKREVINSHVAQQYVDGEELFVQNYINLENLNSELRKIERKYKLLQSPLDVLTQSQHHVAQKMNTTVKESVTDVNLYSFIRNSTLPPYQNFYDAETKRIVFELYEQDFIMLGFDPDQLL
jgi:Sulfotransferase family